MQIMIVLEYMPNGDLRNCLLKLCPLYVHVSSTVEYDVICTTYFVIASAQMKRYQLAYLCCC